MGDDIPCPQCGRPTLPTTGGIFCPTCGHRAKNSELFKDGPPTPPMGISTEPDKDAQATMPDATLLYDVPVLAPIEETRKPPPGSSIFDGGLALQSEAAPGFPADAAPPEEPTVAAPEEPEGPEEPEAPEGPEGPEAPEEGHATIVIHPSEELEKAAEVEPEDKEALFLPRCKGCNNVLELEEIADGECADCLAEKKVSRRKGRAVEAESSLPRLPSAVSGTLASMAATWAGILVIIRAVQSDPDTWGSNDLVDVSLRMALVIFCLVASIVWAFGRPWAGGPALALGPAAAALTLLMLRTGVLVHDLPAASAWLLAGTAGAVSALSAIILPKDRFGRSGRGGGLAGMRKRTRDKDTSSRSQRSRRKSPRGGPKLGSILIGLVALGGAGVAVWRLVLTVKGYPAPLSGAGALATWGWGAAALTGAALALRLIIGAGHQGVGMVALAAAVLAGPLPVWLLLGPRVAEIAGYAGIDPAGARALPAGAARILGIDALAAAAPSAIAFELKAAAGGALALAFVASLLVLIGKGRGRRKAVAGFGLSWVFVWGAGLAAALV